MSTAVMIIGSVVTLLGSAGVLFRYLKTRDSRFLGTALLRPPAYWVAVVVVVLGLFLQVQAIVFYGDSRPSVFAWFFSGISLGAVLAAPGVMLMVSGTPELRVWAADSVAARRPWRFQLGSFLVVVGLFGGLGLPITLAILGF